MEIKTEIFGGMPIRVNKVAELEKRIEILEFMVDSMFLVLEKRKAEKVKIEIEITEELDV